MRFSTALATICLLAEILFLAAIGREFRVFLGAALMVGLFGFIAGKSTTVPSGSSAWRRIRLSHRDFDLWARAMLSRPGRQVSSIIDPGRALDLAFARQVARWHVRAPRWVVMFALPMIVVCGLVLSSPDWAEQIRRATSHDQVGPAIAFGACFGLNVGMPAGWLWRWLRCHGSPPAASRHPGT